MEEMSRASAPQRTSDIESVMREDQIQSVAFRNAELDSERLRLFGVSGCFAMFMLVTVMREFIIRIASGTPRAGDSSWPSLSSATNCGCRVRFGAHCEQSAMFARRLMGLNPIVETSIPALPSHV